VVRFNREEPGVGSKVELGAVVAALDDQPREARTHLNTPHDEPSLLQGAVDRRHETVDVVRREPEEVEVSRLSLDLAPRDQRGAAREREVLGLGEAGRSRRPAPVVE